MPWERKEYEVKSKATTDDEFDSIRYDTIAHHYAMAGADWITGEWKRFHDFIDSLVGDVLDLRGDSPDTNVTEKMDCSAHYFTIGRKFAMIKRIIAQTFNRISPSHSRWDNYYRAEACDHLRPSRRTGRPQMMIDGKWQDMKEIKDENGGPSVWVRDDGGTNENKNEK